MRRHELSEVPIVSVDSFSHSEQLLLAAGDINGDVILLNATESSDSASCSWEIARKWKKTHKKSVRRIRFGLDNFLFSVTANKALTQWDIETGKKLRCLTKSHDTEPFALHVFRRGKTEVVATGDEAGDVRCWDFRAEEPMICEFSEHEDFVSDLCSVDDGKVIISTSGDSTLGAYSFAGKKVLMSSENLNTELASVCSVTTSDGKKRVLCGNADGHLEVFKQGEYGNILERIETAHIDSTVDCVRSIGNNLIVSSSSEDGSIQLLQLNPHVPLAEIGEHGDAEGVEELAVTSDLRTLVSCGQDGAIEFWDLSQYSKRKINLNAQVDSSPDEEEEVVRQCPKGDRKKLKKQKKKPTKVNKQFFKDFAANVSSAKEDENDYAAACEDSDDSD